MLLTNGILECFIQQMKTTDLFGSLNFEWNKKQKCFQVKSKRQQRLYKARFFTSVLFALLVFLQVIWTWNKTSVFVKLHSVFHVVALIAFGYTHRVFCQNAELAVFYLNGMLMFEQRRKGIFKNLIMLKIYKKISLVF